MEWGLLGDTDWGQYCSHGEERPPKDASSLRQAPQRYRCRRQRQLNKFHTLGPNRKNRGGDLTRPRKGPSQSTASWTRGQLFEKTKMKAWSGCTVLFPDWGSVVDQWSVNCLDPGPCCSNCDMHVYEEGEGPPVGPFTPVSVISRNSEGMEMSQGRGASLHSGHAAAGSGHQKVSILHFWNYCANLPSLF